MPEMADLLEKDPAGDAPETMSTFVYRKLRGDILSCRLPPGQKLRIDALTKRYGVGASPTREALNRLSTESFVKRHDQKGFQVAPVSMDELLELTRTRCMLNEITLREALKRGDDAWEDQIILTENKLRRTERRSDGPGFNPVWDDRHKRFHLAIISSCGSRWLIDLSMDLFDCADRYRNLAGLVGGEDRDAVGEHMQIMEAAIDRDADRTVKLMNEHISATAELISRAPLDLKALEAISRPPEEDGV